MTQPTSIENEEAYLLHSKAEIIQKLRLLAKERCMVTAYYDGGSQFINTGIIEVLADKELVVLDYHDSEDNHRDLLNSNRIIVKAFYQGVTVQFSADEITKAKFQGETIFACPLPESLLWLQRRECYRIKIPRSASVTCQISHEDNHQINYPVLDVSVGGIALLDDNQGCKLEIGETYHDCNLVLSNFGSGIVDLEICTRLPLEGHDPASEQRIGCNFVRLSANFETVIQRYINNLDLQRRRIEK